jgi:phosphomannomutase
MNAELLAEVQAWIADDPDPKTAAQLTALVAADDEITLKKYFSGFL